MAVHNDTDRPPATGQNTQHMAWLLALILLCVAVLIIGRIRTAHRVDSAPLGSMSRAWLAEERASHSR
jgi:hypothetical protein